MTRKRSSAPTDSKTKVVKGFTLFAQNLPKNKTTAQVHLHFSKYGRVVACHVSEGKDVYQGADKNNALVTYENEEDLDKALKAKHMMDNRRILTSLHVPSKKEKALKAANKSSSNIKAGITPDQVPLIMNGNPVIFVFGLDLSTPKAHIKKFFSQFGEVSDLELPMVQPGISKGYCYVRFCSVKSVIAVMQQNILRLDNKFLSVLPSVTENKWSSWDPIIETIDMRTKRQKKEDKRREREAARKEREEAAAAAFKKRNDDLKAKIMAKRAETGGVLSEEQVSQVKANPIVVLEGPGVDAGVKAITKRAQEFGSVKLVHVPTDKFLNNKGRAYVHFNQASHALKLLELPYVEINDVCVEVRPVQGEEEKVEAHGKDRSNDEDYSEVYKIYVEGLHRAVVAKEIYGHFAIYGAVTSVDLPASRKKNTWMRNRGFAFVTFANKESLDSALAVPDHKINFKPVTVSLYDPNCSRKRPLEKEGAAAAAEEPCSKKAKRQLKRAAQQNDATSDQEPEDADAESEDDDEDLLSSDEE